MSIDDYWSLDNVCQSEDVQLGSFGEVPLCLFPVGKLLHQAGNHKKTCDYYSLCETILVQSVNLHF